MMLRSRHLACLLLLLSALGAGVAPVGLPHTRIQMRLTRGAETNVGSAASLTPEPQNPGDRAATALPAVPHEIFRTTPAAHPPTAQAASTHTLTGLLHA